MRRRPSRPQLLAALLWLVACTGGADVAECPGVEVATLRLVGSRAAAACLGDTAPADGSAACAAAEPPLAVDCQAVRPAPACCFDRLFPPTLAFTATLAYGALGGAAALCTDRPGASPYLGTRATTPGGEALAVALDTTGAILASCSARCTVSVRHEITGLVTRHPTTGAIEGFAGEHVEIASATPAAACAPCGGGCTARWLLTLAP